jgi:hypothetical protein
LDRYTPDSEGKDVARARATATAKSVDELVHHALKLAATNPKAKWTGRSAKAFFNENEANHKAAMERCLDASRPLLRQVKDGGVLTAEGFERIAGELTDAEAISVYEQMVGEVPEEQVGALTKVAAGVLALDQRADFILEAIRRTPNATAELNPLLADVNAAAEVEAKAKTAAAMKEKQEHDARMLALEETKRLLADSLRIKRDAIRQQWEALGGEPDELRDPDPIQKRKKGPTDDNEGPVAVSREDKTFRRHVADQFAAAWRAAWEANKDEARDYIESAMWNISGLKLIGEPGARVPFDALYHECPMPVSTGEAVKVVRPGWVLDETHGDYTPLKVLVETD